MWVAVGLLVAHVGGMLTAVYIAVGDRTFVALPDYYSKSIKWDQNQDLIRRSEALGWHRSVALNVVSPGNYALQISVTDKDGQPVSGLKAKAVIYPELFPNLAHDFVLSEAAPGQYSIDYVHPAHGPIVIELSAIRGAEAYLTRAVLMTGMGAQR